MKPGIPPPAPDDDDSDPLLAALRQRLSDYGQVPPPAAWAAIRQRLLLAPVRPWWRRPRRLLPLLALLFSLVAIGVLTERRGLLPGSAGYRGGRASVAQPVASRPRWAAPTAASRLNKSVARPAARVSQPAAKELLPATSAISSRLAASSPLRTTAARTATATESDLAKSGLLGSSISSKKTVVPQEKSTFYHRHSTSIPAANQAAANIASAASTRRRHHKYLTLENGLADSRKRGLARPTATRPALAADASLSASAATTALTIAAPKTRKQPAYAAAARRQASRKPLRSPHVVPTPTTQVTGRSGRAPVGTAPEPARSAAASLAGRLYLALGTAAATPDMADARAAVDSLALVQPALALSASALPATLVAAADSGHLAGPPVRRWAVLLVAGPTLSYRTLGPAPTLAAGQPDFARLERPALGFGAQVQVRRVLSGRWAVAVGLGYHEYATRLALSLKDSAYASLRQRDTYRLLTVPVQLSYALGGPHGRLSWALLAGFEPGWYQGGRSTEGSTCSCQQQTYSSAASSPYRSLSLAFSLGLDLRYRLGSAGSRWQWLVQPTGRYVATPFVRSDAVGFTRRQPFSLGLLTGFSWDLR